MKNSLISKTLEIVHSTKLHLFSVAESLLFIWTYATMQRITVKALSDLLTLVTLNCELQIECLLNLKKFKDFFLNSNLIATVASYLY